MSLDFIKNFIKVIEEVEKDCGVLSWPIPSGADKNKGDYGLLPDDTEIRVWAIPRTTGEFLRFLITATISKTILELGTSIGYSTFWLVFG